MGQVYRSSKIIQKEKIHWKKLRIRVQRVLRIGGSNFFQERAQLTGSNGGVLGLSKAKDLGRLCSGAGLLQQFDDPPPDRIQPPIFK